MVRAPCSGIHNGDQSVWCRSTSLPPLSNWQSGRVPCVTSGASLHPSLRSHGDMLYMEQRVPASLSAQGVANLPGVREDEVDQVLSKKDGKIHRPKDPHLWVQALLSDH